MTKFRMLTPLACVALFALAAAPADAGQHHGGGGGSSHGAAVSRGTSRAGGGTVSHGTAQSRASAVVRGTGGSAVVRGGIAVRAGGFVPGVTFYRPYYSFRPRLSLGFGLWMGYPVAYPYYYDYPYGYAYPYPPDPYAYGYAAPSYGYSAPPYAPPNQSSGYPPSNYPSSPYPENGSAGQEYPAQPSAPAVGVQRGGQQSAAPGGISFEITPDTAAVFVDGIYVGTAGSFGPTSQPLGLIVGRHHIEIRAAGYRTMTFDADVRAGQVIPYQGTLQQN